MRRNRTVILSTVVSAAALGLAGCSSHSEPTVQVAELPLTPPAPTSVAVPQSGPLPAPDSLTDLLYRLADPEVPGADKLDTIEGAKPADGQGLDKFVTALKDGGSLPLKLEAADIEWSDREPGHVVATVTVTPANPEGHAFSFPMEFVPLGDGWQLSRKTGEMLLSFAKSPASPPPAPLPDSAPGG